MNEDSSSVPFVPDGHAVRASRSKARPADGVTPHDRYLEYTIVESADRRRLLCAVLVAIAAHGVLLWIHAPASTARTVAAETPPIVHVLQVLRYRPPAAPSEPQLPKPKARRVPMPDPTPDAPEPQRVSEVEPLPIDAIDDLELFVPASAPAAPADEIYPIGGEVTRPLKVYGPAPVYTELARRARIQGLVVLQAVIDREGNVVSAEVVRGLPMGLDQAALDAVRQWRYEPATLRGRPVAVAFHLVVRFEVQ
jgi:periplasmic protein TonB